VTRLKVTHVRLTSLPTIRLRLCLDVSRVRATAPSGRSIVPKSRKPFYLTNLTLTNRAYPAPSMWLVSKVTDREVKTCAV
jgi:hypothetical protein